MKILSGKSFRLGLLLVFVVSSAFSQTNSPKRIALVIGAQNYTSLPPLRNSLNDARAISAVLKQKGFIVQSIYDPKTSKEIKDGIQWYYDQIRLQIGAVGMIYYAGHGMQYKGDNYLIPTTVALNNSGDLEDCIKMNRIMNVLDETSSALHMLVLDACRTVPSFTRDTEQGLSKMSPPEGSIIVYATKAGKVASDGSGSNGLFTSKLLKVMNEPGLKVNDVFKKVQQEVYLDSKKDQLPELADLAIGGDFYFTPGNKIKANDDKPKKDESNLPIINSAENLNKAVVFYNNKNFNDAYGILNALSVQGNDKAQVYLGMMYENGLGVTKDYSQAMDWYRKAAEQGNSRGQINLALMYENGFGVNQDRLEALTWFKMAAAKGDEFAKEKVKNLNPKPKREIVQGLDFGYGPGNSSAVLIGSQRWVDKNLNVNHFANGVVIQEAATNKEWENAGKKGRPAWCYYNNSSAYGQEYGKLYNWYAVTDPRGLCPAGWHAPSKPEWIKLTDYLGSGAGTQMTVVNNAENDGYNFSGRPGGYRNGYMSNYGKFLHIRERCYWWTTSEEYSGSGSTFEITYESGVVYKGSSAMGAGLSVRCVKD